jgi:hypothetical protein
VLCLEDVSACVECGKCLHRFVCLCGGKGVPATGVAGTPFSLALVLWQCGGKGNWMVPTKRLVLGTGHVLVCGQVLDRISTNSASADTACPLLQQKQLCVVALPVVALLYAFILSHSSC